MNMISKMSYYLKKNIKKTIFAVVTKLNKILYPNFNSKQYSAMTILKYGFIQKIVGFNRTIPWPVHITSTVTPYFKIKPGNRAPGMSKYCHIDARNGIEFGYNVWVGPYVKIISMNHDINNYFKYVNTKPILIGNNCWIGAGVIILPEVELGDHTVVAAGAVVTKSFKEGNQIIAGNPAKVIKKLPDYGTISE